MQVAYPGMKGFARPFSTQQGLSEALVCCWSLNRSTISKFCLPNPIVVTDLPSYCWNHRYAILITQIIVELVYQRTLLA